MIKVFTNFISGLTKYVKQIFFSMMNLASDPPIRLFRRTLWWRLGSRTRKKTRYAFQQQKDIMRLCIVYLKFNQTKTINGLGKLFLNEIIE